MTDAERLAIVETKVEHLTDRLAEANSKLDQLVTAANMGKGAWWAALKLGGLIVMVIAAGAWLIDHLPKVFR